MSRRVLGLAVSAQRVSAALVDGKALRWAGSAEYASLADLAEVIARLAGEAGRPVKRVRVGLARDVVQVRSLHPAPPLKARDVSRYVRLEHARLFRKNGVPLVVDGALVAVAKGDLAVWAAAVGEPLLVAILDGCRQAGLEVEAMAPTSDTLPAALDLENGTTEIALADGSSTERLALGVHGMVWQSRWSREEKPVTCAWTPALGQLNGDASAVAPAYAAGVRLPVLALFPDGHRAATRRRDRRRVGMVAIAGLMLWFLAGAVYVGRLSLTDSRATTLLHAFRGAADTALAERRELDEAEATLATIDRARAERSQTLRLVAGLTRALPDSITLIALQVSAASEVRLTGYAPQAAAVLARVGRVPGLRDAGFEGAVTREVMAGVGERDRFTIAAKESRP
ncbi:MAG TPA: PilN domain-containing protein [Gemmatimonadales bacterium]|nr:PilN domain-containing protein [Gemmatimonadales bacterium]